MHSKNGLLRLKIESIQMMNKMAKQILIFGAVVITMTVLNFCEKVERSTPLADLADNEFSCESCHISESMLKLLAPEAEESAGGGG